MYRRLFCFKFNPNNFHSFLLKYFTFRIIQIDKKLYFLCMEEKKEILYHRKMFLILKNYFFITSSLKTNNNNVQIKKQYLNIFYTIWHCNFS